MAGNASGNLFLTLLLFAFHFCFAPADEDVQQSIDKSIQRLNSFASSSSSSGVVTNIHPKSLSQNLSCDSSRSNFSTFESLDLNLSDCAELAGSLPSCTATTEAYESVAKDEG